MAINKLVDRLQAVERLLLLVKCLPFFRYVRFGQASLNAEDSKIIHFSSMKSVNLAPEDRSPFDLINTTLPWYLVSIMLMALMSISVASGLWTWVKTMWKSYSEHATWKIHWSLFIAASSWIRSYVMRKNGLPDIMSDNWYLYAGAQLSGWLLTHWLSLWRAFLSF